MCIPSSCVFVQLSLFMHGKTVEVQIDLCNDNITEENECRLDVQCDTLHNSDGKCQ